MIKHVIFDLGEVFVPETSAQINPEIANKLGVTTERLAELMKPYNGRLTSGRLTLAQGYDKVLKDMKKKDITGKQMADFHLELYKKFTPKVAAPFAYLHVLRRKGLGVHALTNTEKEVADFNAARELFTPFDTYYTSTGLKMKKPDANIYKEALKRIGCKPHEAIFIDDKSAYVEGAKKVGIHAILYPGVTKSGSLPWLRKRINELIVKHKSNIA